MRHARPVWRSRPTPVRMLVAAAVVAAAAHVPVIPAHLRDAPYMGVLFVLFSLTRLEGQPVEGQSAVLLKRDFDAVCGKG